MSVALRVAEAVERGDGLPDHEGVIAFVASLLGPLYNRNVKIVHDDFGAYTVSAPLTRSRPAAGVGLDELHP